MKNIKKKENLFERIEITDPEYAQKMYDKEQSKFKFKLICTAVAFIGSIGGYCMINKVGDDFVISCMSILWLLGLIATIVAGSIGNFFKIILKFGQTAYNIVPFVLIDIVCFVIGLALGLFACLLFPVVPCAITLYQSREDIKSAKDYLALYYHNSNRSGTETSE